MQTVDAAGLSIGDEHPPRIMGVVNVSAESPYEPSVFDDPGEAARYVDRELIEEGADLVDVGLESANKRFDVLSPEAELDRLDIAVETLESVSGDAVFSIETRYHEVADAALSGGFDAVNDICGFADPEMPRVCADYDVAVVKMASPPDLTRPGAVLAGEDGESTDAAGEGDGRDHHAEDYPDAVYDALARNGFTDKTIVDPAFGGWSASKTLADDRATFRRLREFRGYGHPVLVSINRKNFLRELAGRSTEEALPVSLAATALAVERGVHVLRTHDVAETTDAAAIGDAFAARPSSDDELGVRELDVRTAREAARHATRVGADHGVADRTVVGTFELNGLTAAERDVLARAAREHGATVAPGASGDLLVGTHASLRALAAEDLDGRVGRILDRVHGAL